MKVNIKRIQNNANNQDDHEEIFVLYVKDKKELEKALFYLNRRLDGVSFCVV